MTARHRLAHRLICSRAYSALYRTPLRRWTDQLAEWVEYEFGGGCDKACWADDPEMDAH